MAAARREASYCLHWPQGQRASTSTSACAIRPSSKTYGRPTRTPTPRAEVGGLEGSPNPSSGRAQTIGAGALWGWPEPVTSPPPRCSSKGCGALNIDQGIAESPILSPDCIQMSHPHPMPGPCSPPPTGTPEEMVYPGGEVAFVRRMIVDSCALMERVHWCVQVKGASGHCSYRAPGIPACLIKKGGDSLLATPLPPSELVLSTEPASPHPLAC